MNRKLWTEARQIAARNARADRDDLAQDLAVRALERTAPAANQGAWLERVARNAAIDRWRAETRRSQLVGVAELPDHPPDPEAVLLRHERRQMVRRAVAALPPPQRRAALARFHGELSYEQVAERLGTAVPTARTRVYRAIAALRARLAALRAMFLFPGVQTAALGLAFIAASSPAAPTGDVITFDGPAAPHASHLPALRRIAAAAPVTAAPPRPVPPKAARDAHPAPVQTLTFDGDQVEGDISRPDDIVVPGTRAADQASLIELRRDFVPQLLKTLEDL